MERVSIRRDVAQLRKALEELHHAIATAVRERDLRRDVCLTLEACRLRRQLLEEESWTAE